jgi:dUTP pyrophosphatase
LPDRIALSVAMALARLAAELSQDHAFVTAFLANWGNSAQHRGARRSWKMTRSEVHLSRCLTHRSAKSVAAVSTRAESADSVVVSYQYRGFRLLAEEVQGSLNSYSAVETLLLCPRFAPRNSNLSRHHLMHTTPPTQSVIVEALYPDARLPARATRASAGLDLHAYLANRSVRRCRAGESPRDETVSDDVLTLAPGERALVPLGFRARLPEGTEAQLRIRSSSAFVKGLTMPNAPGTIDADYPDEWMVMIRNDSGAPARVEHGERIAQAVLASFVTPSWEPGAVTRTTDRAGGLGSTGTF